ncbi:Predicted membrane protein [Verrucomicrobium sp. GAS474]|uniref:DUF2157 domain-containing protein n=1 Tax=Verrucomicrobium sp. GAS474 TaxID=1882831 RepID=UPI00087A0287|nr:DUF2157 domain-containing protein [Verrucomicrobium sp. GAS474]SDT96213.1 Predicted membrane protein [Verrucomicrobium sp. GAS474]
MAIDDSPSAGNRTPAASATSATSGRFRAWRSEGIVLVDDAELTALEKGLVEALPWERWATRLLAGIATLLLLCGIVLFFAYNWHALPAREKFLVIGAGWVLCLTGAGWLDTRTWAGELSLLGAAVLTGVFLAVFGQVYQTGADSYQLFLGWAALLLPLAAWGRSAALWLLWLVLLNVTLVAGWNQTLFPSAWNRADHLLLWDVALNGTALLLVEAGRCFALPWLRREWFRLAIVAAVTFTLTAAMSSFILEEWVSDLYGTRWTPWLWLAFVAAGFPYYRLVAGSLPALALLTLGFCSVVLVGFAHLLLRGSGDHTGAFLVLGIATLGLFGAAVWGLRVVARRMRAEALS